MFGDSFGELDERNTCLLLLVEFLFLSSDSNLNPADSNSNLSADFDPSQVEAQSKHVFLVEFPLRIL